MASLDKFNFASALISASVTFPAFLAFMRINALFIQSSKHLGLTEQAVSAVSPRSLSILVMVFRAINQSGAENSRWGLSRTFHFYTETSPGPLLVSIAWYTLGRHLLFHLPDHIDDSQLTYLLLFSVFSMCYKLEKTQRTKCYLREIRHKIPIYLEQ